MKSRVMSACATILARMWIDFQSYCSGHFLLISLWSTSTGVHATAPPHSEILRGEHRTRVPRLQTERLCGEIKQAGLPSCFFHFNPSGLTICWLHRWLCSVVHPPFFCQLWIKCPIFVQYKYKPYSIENIYFNNVSGWFIKHITNLSETFESHPWEM